MRLAALCALYLLSERGPNVAERLCSLVSDIRLGDVALVGGKNASLGELYATLSEQGVRVPNGFALNADAYRDALTGAKAWDRLHQLLDNLNKRDVESLAKIAAEARDIVYRATATGPLREQVDRAYQKLETEYGANLAVAVRSFATAEDLPSASFAGQNEGFLNVSARTICSKFAAVVLRQFSPIALSLIASIMASTISRSRSQWA